MEIPTIGCTPRNPMRIRIPDIVANIIGVKDMPLKVKSSGYTFVSELIAVENTPAARKSMNCGVTERILLSTKVVRTLGRGLPFMKIIAPMGATQHIMFSMRIVGRM